MLSTGTKEEKNINMTFSKIKEKFISKIGILKNALGKEESNGSPIQGAYATDYRYERKFFIDNISPDEVESVIKLHPAHFKEIYHARYINNVYLDTHSLKNFFDNVDGTSKRIKFRVRWYGDLLGQVKKPTLEIKIRNTSVGRKESYPLKEFSLDDNFTFADLARVFEESDLPEEIHTQLRQVEPTLINRYKRKYFLSSCSKYRATIDSELSFYKIRNANNHFMANHVDQDNVVLELKYNSEDDLHADKIATYLPFRVTKSSKYVSGVEYTSEY